MHQKDNKKQIINLGQPSVSAIHEILTGDGIIELHFSGSTEKERLLEIKNLYQLTKKEYSKIGQDVFVRKTYWLKASSVEAFAKHTADNGIEPRACIIELMTWYMDSIEKGFPVPAPAEEGNISEFKYQSYRLLNATVTKFHDICGKRQLLASHVLQALIDYYNSKEGE